MRGESKLEHVDGLRPDEAVSAVWILLRGRLRLLGLLSTVALVVTSSGCADALNAITPEAQRSPRSPRVAPTIKPSEAASENEKRMAEADAKRAAEEKTAAEMKAAADASAKADREALGESCAASRRERIADVQKEVKTWAAILKEIAPFEKWAVAHCKQHVDTRGVEVSRERTGVGKVVVRTREVGIEDDVTCDAPLPAAMTKWKVRKILEANADDSDEAQVIYQGRFDGENGRCAQFDHDAGLGLHVRMYDYDGIKKILEAK